MKAWQGEHQRRPALSGSYRSGPYAVQEFVERRVLWVELQPRDGQPPITPLARVLSLLLEPESQVRRISDALHQQAFTDPVAAEVLPLIPEI